MQVLYDNGSMAINGYHLLEASGGFDYDANGKYQVTCELSNSRILNHDNNNAEADEDSTAFYFNALKKFNNDNLELQYSLSYQIQHESIIHDIQALYKYTDNKHVKIKFTTLNVESVESGLWSNREEDRITIEFSYFF